MSEKVKDFILFANQKGYIDLLSDQQAGQLLKALFAKNAGEDFTITDPLVKMAFMVFWTAIENGLAKREKLRENGRNGGRPKTKPEPDENQNETQKNQTKPNQNQTITKHKADDNQTKSDLNIDLNIDLNNPPISNDISPLDEKNRGKAKQSKFSPPTAEEVQAYCDERCNGIDAQHFLDYYAARGWKFKNGEKVRDWKACVRTWERNNKQSAVQHTLSDAEIRQQRNNETCQRVLDEINSGEAWYE